MNDIYLIPQGNSNASKIKRYEAKYAVLEDFHGEIGLPKFQYFTYSVIRSVLSLGDRSVWLGLGLFVFLLMQNSP